MKVLHLLTSGHTGGIESLCRDIGQYGKMTHIFCFLTAGGVVCEEMQNKGMNVINLEKNGKKFSIKKLYKLYLFLLGGKKKMKLEQPEIPLLFSETFPKATVLNLV